MIHNLPRTIQELMSWDWPDFEPFAQELIQRSINADNVHEWLSDWSSLQECIGEINNRLNLAVAQNTADENAEQRFKAYLDKLFPPSQQATQALRQKLLSSGLEPAGFEVTLAGMRAKTALFRQENLPLLAEEQKLAKEYDKISGAQTVQWENQEVTIDQLKPVYQNPDRAVREKAWLLAFERQLADRQAINELWQKLLTSRLKIAANADKPDYRAYCWQNYLRFDYTPADCSTIHQAIEEVVVPAVSRLFERRRQKLGISVLRPWDQDVDTSGLPPLRPFKDVTELQIRTANIFRSVDTALGNYYNTLQSENLLDLPNRKNKAPGAFCTHFPTIQRPFVFMNAVGINDNVLTLLHECGHAFHIFESASLPYSQQKRAPMEFAEVASMAMELLGSPYLTQDFGGFYTRAEAARARIEHLEGMLIFWPYMSVVDSFQHWVYENPVKATEPDECDAQWARLWKRFKIGEDWSGLEDSMMTGWQRKLHIHQIPFYYIEYGLAQLGAAQIWANAIKNQAEAVANYRCALALGGTASLTQLYETAGARLAFDAATLRQSVILIEDTIEDLKQQI